VFEGGGSVGSSEDLHLVSGLDLDTSVVGVLIVEGGEETIVVETVVSSVWHELDVLLRSMTSRSCLGSISHDGDLLVGILILDNDGRGNWIEVSSNIVGVFHFIIFSVPKFLLVHIKTVGINPQFIIS
jgi:hypothetical protein